MPVDKITTTNTATPTTTSLTVSDPSTTRTGSQYSPSPILASSTFSQFDINPSTSANIKMAPTDEKLTALMEKIRQLTGQIEEAEKEESPDTEKQIILRELRYQRRYFRNEFRELVLTDREEKYKVEYEETKRQKEEQYKNKVTRDLGALTLQDTTVPTGEEDKKKYTRSLNMCERYKESIKETSQKLDKIIMEDVSGMTQTAIEQRKFTIESKMDTIKQLGVEYRKYHQDLTSMGERKNIEHYIINLKEVMEIISIMQAKIKMEEDKEKKKLAYSKGEQVEGVKLTRFSGLGPSRYLDYYVWYNEFKEIIIKKEYSDSIKLKYLKQYTEKDALELVRNYHHGKELTIAFKTLDDHYGKPSMVIRESLRNLRKEDSVKSVYDIKANRKLLSNINTNISTLRCYNFDLEGNDVENSTFLIEMEEKTPHAVYIKWEEEKIKIRNEGEEITIQKFIDFYTNIINIEENAQYLRKQGRSDDRGPSHRNQEKALMLHSRLKETNNKPYYKNKYPGNKKTYGKDSAGEATFPRGKDYSQNKNNPSAGGVSWPKYCIFCENNTHTTSFCRAGKHTAKFKMEQCNKHNACYMCFRTSEHKATTCPKAVKCLLCTRTHHFNNHSRSEINEYYKKKDKKQKK